ncbi:MAG: hypothetical protein Q7T85_14340, partial [Nitrosomonas sp.]|nr:hypothetical protein [Nitrosomonas sp.]
EWCLNSYDQPSDISLNTGSGRVVRGCSWGFSPDGARASARSFFRPVARDNLIGFRVLCSSPIE